VRGIAVLTVMVLHFTILVPTTPGETILATSVSGGWAGVDLFFVLSGFLITGILLDARGAPGYFRTFYARRSLRIFPLYYAFLFVLFAIFPLLRASGAEPMGPQLWTLAYLNNFLMAFGGWEAVPAHTTHLWSLAIEEQFYLIWPLVVLHNSRRTLLQACLAAIGIAWLTRLSLYIALDSGTAGYALLPARMDALALGGILALLVREEGWAERLARWVRPAAMAGALLLVVTAVLSTRLTPESGPFPPLALHVQLLGYPGVDLLSAALVGFAVLPGESPLRALLTRPILMKLGKYSYALYLLHVPLRDLLRGRIFDGGLPRVAGSQVPVQLLLLVGCIALTYLVSLASWHFFEKHFLSLKKRFEYRRPEGGDAPRMPAVVAPAP
jgi:peptidoglycan/LPS O-acetylase OafA/YrhL